ncbi:MAG: signal recognition particle-docking protein FtsY [Chloroflexota bacterium]
MTPEPPSASAGAPDLEAGLTRSRGGFMARLRGLFGASSFSEEAWTVAEEALIGGDLGAALAGRVIATARGLREAESAGAAIRSALGGLLIPRDSPWDLDRSLPGHPAVVLVVGVNGTGKTTTVGKLAMRETAAGRRVVLAAADTFRAAAADQLRIWAERSHADLVAHAPGADPGAVVFDALDAGIARGADTVIVDTAGRLHTKTNLMDELAKIRRIIDRRLPGARPEILFVLDATTGQNGLAQAAAFHRAVGLTGVVLTKLDSTSRGGIVFAIEDELRIPVRYVGVGEGPLDLLPFEPEAFVSALYGSPGA